MMPESKRPEQPVYPDDPKVHVYNLLHGHGRDNLLLWEVLDVSKHGDEMAKISMEVFRETMIYTHQMVPSPRIDQAVTFLFHHVFIHKDILCNYYRTPASLGQNGLHGERVEDTSQDIVIIPSFDRQRRMPFELVFTPLFIDDAIDDPLLTYQRIIDVGSTLQDLYYERPLIERTFAYLSLRSQALQAEFLWWYNDKFPEYQFSFNQNQLLKTFPPGYKLPPEAMYSLQEVGKADEN